MKISKSRNTIKLSKLIKKKYHKMFIIENIFLYMYKLNWFLSFYPHLSYCGIIILCSLINDSILLISFSLIFINLDWFSEIISTIMLKLGRSFASKFQHSLINFLAKSVNGCTNAKFIYLNCLSFLWLYQDSYHNTRVESMEKFFFIWHKNAECF